MAFLPVGSRARLEHDALCLFEAYQMPYDSVMSMPCSRRHRFIKMREMVIEQQNSGDDFGQTPITVSTGLGPSAGSSRQAVPMGPSS